MEVQDVRTWGKDWLGASPDRYGGTHFRVFTGLEATGVKLFLYPDVYRRGDPRVLELERQERGDGTCDWYVFDHESGSGQVYTYRVDGPNEPGAGFRYDPERELFDPAARILARGVMMKPWCSPMGYVLDPEFDWGEDRPLALQVPRDKLVVREAHPRGATVFHPDISPGIQGTYAALGSEPYIADLMASRTNALELMPVQANFLPDESYWGYGPSAFGALERNNSSRYLLSRAKDLDGAVQEFKEAVKRLHEAGVLVILDVVFNHTAEGNEFGPTMSIRGFDNFCYMLQHENGPGPGPWYTNRTGCGNTVNCAHPSMQRLIVQMLYRFVFEYHVDGFRFDLAGDLFSRPDGFDPEHPLLTTITNDSVLSQCILIAEPWSALGGEGCYATLPSPWMHWSKDYRNTMRRIWIGQPGLVGHFARCQNGCQLSYPPENHGAFPVVSAIIHHDGFTFGDWLRFNQKKNPDGSDENFSWNCGEEGVTDDETVVQTRRAIWKAAWASLACTSGPIQYRSGDMRLFSTGGHNNPYDHGDEKNGIHWDLPVEFPGFLEYSRRVMGMRMKHPGLRNHRLDPNGDSAFGWYWPEGERMNEHGWANEQLREAILYLRGDAEELGLDEEGGNLLLLFGASDRAFSFLRPKACEEEGRVWELRLHTGAEDPFAVSRWEGDEFMLHPRSLAVFVSVPKD